MQTLAEILCRLVEVETKHEWNILPLTNYFKSLSMHTLNSLPQQNGAALVSWYLPQSLWHCTPFPGQPNKYPPPVISECIIIIRVTARVNYDTIYSLVFFT